MAAGSTYTPIATYTAPSSQTSYTFNSFGGYTDLVLVMSVQNNTTGSGVCLQFNGDTGSNYSITTMWGSGSSATSARTTNATYGTLTYGIGPGVAANTFATITTNLMNYSNSTTYKTYISRDSNAVDPSGGVESIVGLWRNTAAITSIKILETGAQSFVAGSTFTLYGIAKA